MSDYGIAGLADYLSRHIGEEIPVNTTSSGIGALGKAFSGIGTDATQAWGNLSGLGKVGTALGVGQSLMGLWGGYQQQKLAKKSFNLQAGLMQGAYDNQVRSMNSQLEDRQRARVARDPNAHEGVSSYMDRYGAK